MAFFQGFQHSLSSGSGSPAVICGSLLGVLLAIPLAGPSLRCISGHSFLPACILACCLLHAEQQSGALPGHY